MEEKDFIKDLFQEKLSNLETPVRPEVWSAVSSSIGATSATSGLSLISKLIIGTSLTAAVSVGIWFAVSDSKDDVKSKKESLKTKEKSALEKKEDAQNKDVSQPKFSDVQINTEVDKFILLPPEPESIFESEEIQQNINPNNSISEHKGQISDEKRDFQPIIEQKIDSKSDSKVDNVVSEQIAATKQTPIQSEVKISLPNVFTPNGDGNNDYFSLPKNELSDFSLVILDEKGKTIFTTTDVEFTWDGTILTGEKATEGKYVYFITAKDSNGKTFTKYSNLSIRY